MKKLTKTRQHPLPFLKGIFFLSLFAFSSFYSKAGGPIKAEADKQVEAKRNIIVWCEVRGIYSKYTGYDGVPTHVCSFVSLSNICYYIPCSTMRAEIIPKMKPAFQPPVPIEQTGDEFYLLIPNSNGYEVVQINNPNIKVDKESVVIY